MAQETRNTQEEEKRFRIDSIVKGVKWEKFAVFGHYLPMSWKPVQDRPMVAELKL